MLIDEFLPKWDARERHSVKVNAPVDEVCRAMRRMDLRRARLTNFLLKLRGISAPADFSIADLLKMRFVRLAEEPDKEIVLGLTGKFWQANGSLVRVEKDDFVHFDKLAYTVPERGAAFFWIGGRGQAMLGVWETGSSPNRIRLHIAFTTTIEQILSAPAQLKKAGINPKGFHGEPVEEPVVIGWMPALSIYFDDPDGHLLEYIAMLPDAPQPEIGVVSFSHWNQLQQKEPQ